MIKSYLNNIKKTFNDLNYFEKFFITFPIFAIIGSFAINIFYLSMVVLFVYSLCEKINIAYYKSYFFFCFLTFLIIIFSFILSDFKNTLSFTRTIFSFRFFLIVMIFLVFVKNKKFFLLLGQISYILLLFLSSDIIFQYFFGFDFFGFEPYAINRYSGFFDEELIAGSYLATFYLFSIIYIYSDYKFSKFIIFFIIVFCATIITGERLALLKFLFLNFGIIVFLIKGFKKKLLFALLIIFAFSTAFFKIQSFKTRTYEALFYIGFDGIKKIDKDYETINNDSITTMPWVAHWIVAFTIFKDYPLSGVGVKNFRKACLLDKYDIKNSITNTSCTSHPHNLYLEIFSELGIIGIIALIFYIYLFFKKIKSLKGKFSDPPLVLFLAYIVFILIPILPSGSIFSSYYGGILFFLISSTVAYLKIIKK